MRVALSIFAAVFALVAISNPKTASATMIKKFEAHQAQLEQLQLPHFHCQLPLGFR